LNEWATHSNGQQQHHYSRNVIILELLKKQMLSIFLVSLVLYFACYRHFEITEFPDLAWYLTSSRWLSVGKGMDVGKVTINRDVT
jgi:hypothetical protein